MLAAVPLVGLAEGLVAGLATLPPAYRLRGWLFQPAGDRRETPPLRHLLAGAGVGLVHAVLALLALVALPGSLLERLALARPSLPWTVPAVAAAALLWVGLWLANQPTGDPAGANGPAGGPPG